MVYYWCTRSSYSWIVQSHHPIWLVYHFVIGIILCYCHYYWWLLIDHNRVHYVQFIGLCQPLPNYYYNLNLTTYDSVHYTINKSDLPVLWYRTHSHHRQTYYKYSNTPVDHHKYKRIYNIIIGLHFQYF